MNAYTVAIIVERARRYRKTSLMPCAIHPQADRA
jgi:hypothetical protein